MDCPKCNSDMEILDYETEYDGDCVTARWEVKCPKCGYHANYYEFYRRNDVDWEEITE